MTDESEIQCADAGQIVPFLPPPSTVMRPIVIPLVVPAQLYLVREHQIRFTGFGACEKTFIGQRPWQHAMCAYEDKFGLTRGSVSVKVDGYKMNRDAPIGLSQGTDTPHIIEAVADADAASTYRIRVWYGKLNLSMDVCVAKYFRVAHLVVLVAHAFGLRPTRTALQTTDAQMKTLDPQLRLREAGIRERLDGYRLWAIEIAP